MLASDSESSVHVLRRLWDGDVRRILCGVCAVSVCL